MGGRLPPSSALTTSPGRSNARANGAAGVATTCSTPLRVRRPAGSEALGECRHPDWFAPEHGDEEPFGRQGLVNVVLEEAVDGLVARLDMGGESDQHRLELDVLEHEPVGEPAQWRRPGGDERIPRFGGCRQAGHRGTDEVAHALPTAGAVGRETECPPFFLVDDRQETRV